MRQCDREDCYDGEGDVSMEVDGNRFDLCFACASLYRFGDFIDSARRQKNAREKLAIEARTPALTKEILISKYVRILDQLKDCEIKARNALDEASRELEQP